MDFTRPGRLRRVYPPLEGLPASGGFARSQLIEHRSFAIAHFFINAKRMPSQKVQQTLFCHSRGGGNPVSLKSPGLPPEFTPAQAEAGVTTRATFCEANKTEQFILDAQCSMKDDQCSMLNGPAPPGP